MSRKYFALAGAMLLALAVAACNPSVPTDQPASDGTGSSVAADAVSSAQADATASAPAQADSAPAGDQAMRTIDVTVKNFEFSPNEIHIKKGEKVTLHLIGTEGTHGFAVPDLGINLSVSAGQTVSVAIPTDKTGTFQFFCSIPCGPGHKGMKGTIVIE